MEGYTPEQRQEYRHYLSDAIRSARKYNGTKKSFDTFIESTGLFEEWMGENFGEDNRLSTEKEIEISHSFRPERKEFTVDVLLDLAQVQLRSFLEKTNLSSDQLIKYLEIPDQKVDLVFVPSGESTGIVRKTGARKFLPAETAPRFQRLLSVLYGQNFHSEDLEVISGRVASNSIRKNGYKIVRILSKNKEVLVSDESGQATYISEVIREPEEYAKNTKDELVSMPGMHRIIHKNSQYWSEKIIRVLNSNSVSIDIQSDPDLLSSFIMMHYSCSDFINAYYEKAFHDPSDGELKIMGLSLIQIAKCFGIKIFKSDKNYHWVLFHTIALRIFGEREMSKAKILHKQVFEINEVMGHFNQRLLGEIEDYEYAETTLVQ